QSEFRKYCKSGKLLKDIPKRPEVVYKEEWKGWGDYLGTGRIADQETGWSIERVKQLLRYLIESKIIYEWDEAVLYSLLLRRGVLNLDHKNRYSKFFKQLIPASNNAEGRKAIEKYAYSDEPEPPSLLNHTIENDKIVTATSAELAREVENEKTDALNHTKLKTPKQILAQTNFLESICEDVEAMQFYLTYSVTELWKSAFRNEIDTVDEVRRESRTGKRFHDTIRDIFLSEYEMVKSIREPKGYRFSIHNVKSPPTLMQKYVAYKVKTASFFGNFSGTGAGKTLSAILASRIINSRMTLIVCPNDVVDQWKTQIEQAFPEDSTIVTGKEAFDAKYDSNKYQYLILNYDKFSQDTSPNLILNLVKQKVDFLVFDEIHFVKRRLDKYASKRHKMLAGLRSYTSKKNPLIKILGMSATPVVNNLNEGKSLLELITRKKYHDLATKARIPNAVSLYEKLSTISIREIPEYKAHMQIEFTEVNTEKPSNISVKSLKSNPLLIEQILTDARLPEIIKRIKGQTIIYTKYVSQIVNKLKRAVENEGYSVAEYTGFSRELDMFLSKRAQVLIASDPISVGVDGLQLVCNNLIINTLPWTNAQYQQLIGRLHRIGQVSQMIKVHIIKASIEGYPYDHYKWNRIEFKRTLADCAVDGWLPEKNLVSPYQMQMEAIRWLERLERGEVSSVIRKDLDIKLTNVEIQRGLVTYGDFARMNNLMNNENSQTTYFRIQEDPTFWQEYHRQYDETSKLWPIKPVLEIIKRIKQLSPRLIIGDFGCGKNVEILKAFGSHRVHSFDFVLVNDNVTACDMKSIRCLKNGDLDIAVFSLSLMSRNWQEFIIEAKRCLATNGYLLIAETTNSLKKRLSKLRTIIEENGFEIYKEYKDTKKGDFTFIEARKL
ncbi:MAG: DEAD/DEAH box helicase family protein, partial [Nitrososphaeraceae archaeon]